MIELIIDGKKVVVPEGYTILEAARGEGIYIPTLCYHEALSPIGSCRVCLVEVEGEERPVASCTTLTQEGMKVITDSPHLREQRLLMLQLLLLQHPLDCPICDAGGQCRLQDLVYEFGLKEQPYTAQRVERRGKPPSPLIEVNQDRCILCGRCVKVCSEVQGAWAIDYEIKEGFASSVGLGPYPCESCSQCLAVCPVGTLIDRTYKNSSRPWLLTTVKSVCPFCSTGCNVLLHVQGQKVFRITTQLDEHKKDGLLCSKGRFGHTFLRNPERLKRPLLKEDKEQRETTWEEAISFAAQRLKEIKEKYGPKSIAGLISSRCTNEEAYLFQKFFRACLGTNNIDSLGRFENFGPIMATQKALGAAASTCSFEDLEKADLVMLLGTEVMESHPVFALRILEAARWKNVKTISIGQRLNKMARLSHKFYKPNPGSDWVLLSGILSGLLAAGKIDEAALKARHEGFEAVKEQAKAFSPEEVSRETGLSPEEIEEIIQDWASAQRAIIVLAQGSVYEDWSIKRSQAALNLLLATGHMGQEGQGLILLMDKANLQGVLDMGVSPHYWPGWYPLGDENKRLELEKVYGVPLPREPGLASEAIFGAKEGKEIKALYLVGADLKSLQFCFSLASLKLNELEFLMVEDIFESELTAMADVVLPAASFAEKDGTFTNASRCVQKLNKAFEPLTQSKADWEILCMLSETMGYKMPYSGPSAIMKEIHQVVDLYQGIDYPLLDKGPQRWPLNKASSLAPFEHPFGKGRFYPLSEARGKASEAEPSPYPFLLLISKNLHHCGDLSQRSAHLMSLCPRDTLEMNPSDASSLGLKEGDRVWIKSQQSQWEMVIKPTEELPEGLVSVPLYDKEAVMRIIGPLNGEKVSEEGMPFIRVSLQKA